jgi:Ni,Fe-hydrogenase III large subunit
MGAAQRHSEAEPCAGRPGTPKRSWTQPATLDEAFDTSLAALSAGLEQVERLRGWPLDVPERVRLHRLLCPELERLHGILQSVSH